MSTEQNAKEEKVQIEISETDEVVRQFHFVVDTNCVFQTSDMPTEAFFMIGFAHRHRL